MKKRILILSNMALAGVLTMMGCSKKVISDPIEQPEQPQSIKDEEPRPLLYGPPPVRFEPEQPADTNTKTKEKREPIFDNEGQPEVKALYGVPPAKFELIEEKK